VPPSEGNENWISSTIVLLARTFCLFFSVLFFSFPPSSLDILSAAMRASILVGFSALASLALATPEPAVDVNSCKRSSSNDIVGTWTLTYANQTANGQTTLPFGPNPHGFLFITGAPDLTWIEEVEPTDPSESQQPAQSSAGYYKVDGKGDYLGRGIVSSTVANADGVYSPASVLNLIRIDHNTILQQYYPAQGVHIMAIWTKWVPGTTTYPSK
jgi:hypothetical protein